MNEPQHSFESTVAKPGCQFSVLAILGVTAFVAVACGAVLAIAKFTGTSVVQAFLTAGGSLMFHLPVALVWIVALTLFLNRWNNHPRVSLYGALGVGGSLVVMVLSALCMTWLQAAMSQRSGPDLRDFIMWIYHGLMFTLSLLRATCWGLVVAAALKAIGSAKGKLADVQ